MITRLVKQLTEKLTNLINPQRWVSLAMLMTAIVVNEFPDCTGKRGFITMFRKVKHESISESTEPNPKCSQS